MQSERDARRRALLEKTKAEIEELTAQGCSMSGNAFSSLLLLKGSSSKEEKAGGSPLSGPDGTALRASFAALGYAPEDWAALLTVSEKGEPLSPELLREAIAVLDPATLICCDEEAAAAVREAYANELAALEDFTQAMLEPGELVQLAGMRVLNLGGFASALESSQEKQRMWARLKRIPPLGEPY